VPAPSSLPPGASLLPPVISGFGDSRGAGGPTGPWQHNGIDIRAPVGTPVLAAADGEVLRIGEGRAAGRMVVVGHGGGPATVYMHLSEIGVRPGQPVRRGEPVGRSGMTGNATTPHLHFGVCGRADGHCGPGIESGWDDPAHHWVEGNPCYEPGHAYPPGRFTYPLPCG
jgi:murein DD-endopeptidase MepM/ murein hydrolase activator NlpD